MPGSFALMSFADREDPEIISVDSMAGDLLLVAEAEVRGYGGTFDNLMAEAVREALCSRRVRHWRDGRREPRGRVDQTARRPVRRPDRRTG
ncbi:Scr1 family TA system antitoxin-like transcriptional regulator [Streptomyces mayteni]